MGNRFSCSSPFLASGFRKAFQVFPEGDPKTSGGIELRIGPNSQLFGTSQRAFLMPHNINLVHYRGVKAAPQLGMVMLPECEYIFVKHLVAELKDSLPEKDRIVLPLDKHLVEGVAWGSALADPDRAKGAIHELSSFAIDEFSKENGNLLVDKPLIDENYNPTKFRGMGKVLFLGGSEAGKSKDRFKDSVHKNWAENRWTPQFYNQREDPTLSVKEFTMKSAARSPGVRKKSVAVILTLSNTFLKGEFTQFFTFDMWCRPMN